MSDNQTTRYTLTTLTYRLNVAPDALDHVDPELLQRVSADIARDMQQASANVFMTGKTHREFVCQGCGKVAAVLYGNKIKCGCGITSAAEIMS